MKKFRIVLSLSIVLLVAFLLASCKKEKNNSMVTISTNPEISLIVNSKGVVLSAKGENDEGKIIIEGENLEGKEVEEVIEIIIKNEEESGFLISGSVSDKENKIEVKVSADKDKIKNKIEKAVTKTVETVCDELNIQENIQKAEAYTKEELEKLASKYNCYLSEVEAAKMSYDELLVQVSNYYQEVKGLVSVELENLYLSSKEYEFAFAQKEEVLEKVDQLESKYQEFKVAYGEAINQLKKVIEDLEKVHYDYLVDPECEYQKQLAKYYQAKEKLNSKKAELAEKDELDSAVGQLAISGLEASLDAMHLVLVAAKDAAELALTAAKNLVSTAITALESLEASFLEEIKSTVITKLELTQEQMNQYKDEFFASFEAKYGEAIQKAKENAANKK